MDRHAHEQTRDIPQPAQQDPVCPNCDGTGKDPGQKDRICARCTGTGILCAQDVTQTEQTDPACPSSNRSGVDRTVQGSAPPCTACGCTGRQPARR